MSLNFLFRMPLKVEESLLRLKDYTSRNKNVSNKEFLKKILSILKDHYTDTPFQKFQQLSTNSVQRVASNLNATWVPYNYYTDIVPFVNSERFQKGRFLLYVDEEKDFQTVIIAKLSDGNIIHIRNKYNFPPQHTPVYLLVNNYARQFQSNSMQQQMQKEVPVQKQSTSYSKVYQSKKPQEAKQSKSVPESKRQPPKQSKAVPKASKAKDNVAEYQAQAKADIESFSKDKSKKTFRKLSLKYHPDKLSNKSSQIKKIGQQTFKQINQIYNM